MSKPAPDRSVEGLSSDEVAARRRKDLLDHRDEVRSKWHQIVDTQLENNVSRLVARRAAYEVAEWFVADLSPLMRPDFGEEPPTEIDWWHREVGRFDLPNGDTYVVEDLGEFVEMRPVWSYSWEEMAETDERGQQKQQREKTVSVPKRVSKSAVRMGEHFIADVGLEIDLTAADSGASWSVDDYRE